MDPAHALYVLLDSNLPTGGFVASGGLESYAKHGFLSPPPTVPYRPDLVGGITPPDLSFATDGTSASASSSSTQRPQSAAPLGPSRAGPAVMHFSNAEMDNFESSTGAYLRGAYDTVRAALDMEQVPEADGVDSVDSVDGIVRAATDKLLVLDRQHEATLLSHVARRASKTQGVALLTLYARGMGPPPGFEAAPMSSSSASSGLNGVPSVAQAGAERKAQITDGIIAQYRRAIRLGAPGHLALCFGVVAAAVGLDLETTRHLYLFTHARSTLSAAVRLNIVGPYLSTQLLSYPVKTELDEVLTRDRARASVILTGVRDPAITKAAAANGTADDDWAWADEAETGPATTWPLGEILAARHDLQHSRIFNS